MKKRVCLWLAALLAALSAGGVWFAYAGMSQNKVSDFGSSDVNTSHWANPTGTVGISGKTISFSDSTAKNALVINRGYAADIHEYYPERETVSVFEADFTLEAETIPSEFAFVYGLRGTTSSESFGRAGQSAVIVEETEGNLSVGVSYFESKNTPSEVVAPVAVGTTTESLKISVRASRRYSGETFREAVTVRAKSGEGAWVTVADNAEAGPSVGYFGFGQNEACRVRITECLAYVYEYVTAENTSDAEKPCVADFNSGTYNLNEWHTEGNYGYFSPSFLGVREGKLVFENMANASLSTRHKYSNLELSFTLSDLSVSAEKDGVSVGAYDPSRPIREQYDRLVSSGLYILLGCSEIEGQALENVYFHIEPCYGEVDEHGQAIDIAATVNGSFTGAPNCTRLTYFDGQNKICRQLPDNLWTEEVDAVSFRLSMEDGKISFAYSLGGDDWKEVELPDTQSMPYGYVKLVSKGFGKSVCEDLELAEMADKIRQANFALDDVTLRNLDIGADKVLVTVPFQGIEYERKDDVYTDNWSEEDLIWNRLEGGSK